jgi:hypothetical protein
VSIEARLLFAFSACFILCFVVDLKQNLQVPKSQYQLRKMHLPNHVFFGLFFSIFFVFFCINWKLRYGFKRLLAKVICLIYDYYKVVNNRKVYILVIPLVYKMKIGLYAIRTFGKRKTEAAEGMEKILRDSKINLDVLVAPEYANVSVDTALRLSKIDEGVLLIPGTTLVQSGDRIYNRAFIVQNGDGIRQEGDIIGRDGKILVPDQEIITCYDKMSGIARVGYSDADHKIPGDVGIGQFACGAKPCVFDYVGKRIGIEICADNDRGIGNGSNKKPVLNHFVGNTLDMQIVMSCGAAGFSPNAVKPNGYALLIDGDKNPSAVVRGANGDITPVNVIAIGADPAKEDKLYVFNIR